MEEMWVGVMKLYSFEKPIPSTGSSTSTFTNPANSRLLSKFILSCAGVDANLYKHSVCFQKQFNKIEINYVQLHLEHLQI